MLFSVASTNPSFLTVPQQQQNICLLLTLSWTSSCVKHSACPPLSFSPAWEVNLKHPLSKPSSSHVQTISALFLYIQLSVFKVLDLRSPCNILIFIHPSHAQWKDSSALPPPASAPVFCHCQSLQTINDSRSHYWQRFFYLHEMPFLRQPSSFIWTSEQY